MRKLTKNVISVLLIGVLFSCGEKPETVIKNYLEAPSAEERVKFISIDDSLKEVFFNYYNHYRPSKLINIREVKPVNDNYFIVSGKYAFNERQREFEYYLIKTNDGIKIDWLNSVGYNPISKKMHEIQNPKSDVAIKAELKLTDNYHSGLSTFTNMKSTHYAIKILGFGWENEIGYVEKDSDIGKRLIAVLQDEQLHKFEIIIRRMGRVLFNVYGGRMWREVPGFYILDIKKETWY